MTGLYKFDLKTMLLFLRAMALCLALTFGASRFSQAHGEIYSSLTYGTGKAQTDTIPPQRNTTLRSIQAKTVRPDTLPANSGVPSVNTKSSSPDSTVPTRDTFSLRLSKDTLDAQVHYEAADSAVLLVKEQIFILYGKTRTSYKDVTVTAPQTELNQQTNILTAYSKKDSLGRMITRAIFEQGSQKFESETFRYNFKTQKGSTSNTYTKQGDLFVKSNISKKIDSATVFVKGGYFTTCNLDDPHFAFKANKMKMISNKLAITGPVHPEFEGVPIPLYLPFGIFPLNPGRHSGLLAPQFTANQQFGIGLEGLGYYQVLNDNYDITIRSNIYSYGGWNVNFTPSYRKRYHFNGSFNLAIQHTKFNFKGDPDYQLIKSFQINWNHSVDSRARPGTSFSASVNAGSTQFNKYVPNSPYRNIQNQLQSSISYSKTWQGKPYSLQLSANHNQNNSTRQVFVTLPDAGFTVSTLYPFQRKIITGSTRWYEKIGIGYSGVVRNQVAFTDTGKVSIRSLLDTLQTGAQHRFPLSIQLPPLGKVIVNPGINYEETWYTRRYSRKWDQSLKKVDTITVERGLYTDRQLSFNMGLNTSIYGLYAFKNSRIIAIRHVIRPTISFSYKPNISRRNYNYTQIDSFGTYRQLAQFDGNLFAPYSYGRFGGLSFGVDNNLEMKVRSKTDTTKDATKKIKLIDGFGFQSAYNFLDTAFKLQPFSLYLRTTLFEKISISAQGQIDPYQVNLKTGQPINRFVWDGGRFTLGRFTGGNISASTSFQGGSKGGIKPNEALARGRNITDPRLLADAQSLADYMQRNPAEFVDFNIPWSIGLSYSMSINRRIKSDYSGFSTEVVSSVSFNNTFNLTPKWNIGTNGYYDLKTSKLTLFTMSIAREMHCWQMSIGVTPIGSYRSFNVTISPKASILHDLKVNRSRSFYSQ